ncbi:MAG: alkaline phosphatase family protein [Actinomycetota bacterium]
MTRVAVLGLDAAERTYVEALMNAGEMTNLARIRERSAKCNLDSEEIYRVGRIWETFVIGKADYPSAVRFDPSDYSTFKAGARKVPPFYYLDPGLETIVFDVPYSSLWFPVDGAQVTSWGGHDAGFLRASRPSGLLTEIEEKFGGHPAFLNDYNTGWHHAPSITVLTDALLVGARRRMDSAIWLQEQFPNWDLFLTVMSEAHSAGEYFWHGADPEHPLAEEPTAEVARESLLRVHRGLDDEIGRFANSLPPETTLVVCSLHGMQTNPYDVAMMVLLPELLNRWQFGRGLFQFPDVDRWRRRGCPPIRPEQDQKWGNYAGAQFALESPDRLKRALRTTLPSPVVKGARSARRALARRPKPPPPEALAVPAPPEAEFDPARTPEPHASVDWQVPCWYRPMWPRMKAFALPSFYDSRIRINLEGRERDGVVPKEDYTRVCDDLERLLENCRDVRTGRQAVSGFKRMRSEDPMDPEGPDADLVVYWGEAVDALEHPELGAVGPFPFRRTGGHTGNGFAYISGPGIRPGYRGAYPSTHLTPTVLDLLGRQVPEELHGHPIPNLLG